MSASGVLTRMCSKPLYRERFKSMLRIMFIVFSLLIIAECANGAELTQRDNDFNWQDREYFGRAYTERQLGGGDSATAGDAGDGGAAAGGATGGDSGDGGGTGSGCGR